MSDMSSPACDSVPVSDTFHIRDGMLNLHVCRWPGERRPFVLLHGLSSNKRTWEMVAQRLAAAGHAVYTVDQRGHGLSDKPESGYDFTTVGDDLHALLAALDIDAPIIGGQSWGGNVALDFAARYPGRAWGYAFVDGGVLDLRLSEGSDWETVAATLRPPTLTGIPAGNIEKFLLKNHPEWGAQGVEVTMANFERLPDGTVRPWLPLDTHMQIARYLWEQQPGSLFALVEEPVLICAALEEDESSPRTQNKRRMVAAAEEGLPVSKVVWFPDTAHDIHVHRPRELAELFLSEVENGIWSEAAKVSKGP